MITFYLKENFLSEKVINIGNIMDIKELRIKKGLSQQELSDKTGIPRGRIAKWEEGKAKPKTDDYKTLEKFFANDSNKPLNPLADSKDNSIDAVGYRETPEGNTEVVIVEAKSAKDYDENELTVQSLARSIALSAKARLHDAESRKIEARNVERLISLLEVKFGMAVANRQPEHPVTEDLGLEEKERTVKPKFD